MPAGCPICSKRRKSGQGLKIKGTTLKKESGDVIVLEAKTSTWPIGSVSQLGDYLEELSKKKNTRKMKLHINTSVLFFIKPQETLVFL